MIKNKALLVEKTQNPTLKAGREVLIEAVEYAFHSIDLASIFSKYLDKKLNGQPVTAIGKASVSMLQNFQEIFEVGSCIVVSKADFPVNKEKVEFFKAGHPFPDRNSMKAAKFVLKTLKNASPNSSFVFLISGGGSSLFELPRVPLEDLANTTKMLLFSGATIEEINTVRKHLSQVKGGQLLRHLKSKATAFLMSDVVNDRIDLIASGLTSSDPSTYQDALNVLQKYELWTVVPKTVQTVILEGIQGHIPETLKDWEPEAKLVENYLILTNRDFLTHMETYLRSMGFEVISLGSDNHIDVDLLANKFTSVVHSLKMEGTSKKFAILAGGEVGVKVRGNGKGGRCQELALRLSLALSKENLNYTFLTMGTDGIDGPTDAAGALADSDTIHKAFRLSLNPEEKLLNNDSYNLFKTLGDLIITGPTGINVKDIYGMLILEKQTN